MSNVGGYCSFTPFGNNLFSPLIQFIPRAIVVVVTVLLYTHLFFFLRRTNLFSAVTSKTATNGIAGREVGSGNSRESPYSNGSGGSNSKQGGMSDENKEEGLNLDINLNGGSEEKGGDGDSTLVQRRAQSRSRSPRGRACSCGCSNCVNSEGIGGSGKSTNGNNGDETRRKSSFSTIKTLPNKLMNSFSSQPSSTDESIQQKCNCVCQPQVLSLPSAFDQDQPRPPLMTMLTIASEPENEDQNSMSSNLNLVQWQSGHGFHSRLNSNETGRRNENQDPEDGRSANQDATLDERTRTSSRKPYTGLKPLFTQPFTRAAISDGSGREMEMVNFPNSTREEEISPHQIVVRSPKDLQSIDSSPTGSNDKRNSEHLKVADDQIKANSNGARRDSSSTSTGKIKRKTSRLSTADGTYSSFGGEDSEAGSNQISSRRGKFPIPLKIKRPHTSGGTSNPSSRGGLSTSFA